MDNNIKIISINVRGLQGSVFKRRDIFHWVKQKNASIVCLQETHSTKNDESYWTAEWGYKCIFSHCSSNSAGVAIFFRNTFEFIIHRERCDCQGRFIILDITINGNRITLVNLYGYNDDNPSFFRDLKEEILFFENSSIIMCGDWNTVQDLDLDTYNILHDKHQQSRAAIQDLKNELELIDPWRNSNQDLKMYTWRQKSPLKQSRLDYFLVSDDIHMNTADVRILPGYKTDHSAIVLSVALSTSPRGKGYWKFNAQLLKNIEYTDLVKKCITDTVNEYYVRGNKDDYLHVYLSCNDQMFFEILKMKIRSETISYSIKKTKEKQQKLKKIEQEIIEIQGGLVNNIEGKALENLERKKAELEESRKNYIEGVILRSKARWYEFGEKSTKYFLSLEKRNYVNKTIKEIILDDETNISDQIDILEAQKQFYLELYKSRTAQLIDEATQETLNRFLNHNIKLSQEERESCEGLVTINEVGMSLKRMKNGKSPGSDGFTVEFYKFFWKYLGGFLCRSINYGYTVGKLSDFQTQGVITCLPKEEKDRRYLKNWRPISLLNIDYKIASGAIAARIKKVLPSIISDTQKGYMKGRFIGENTRLLYDIMNQLENENRYGLLLLIDFEKAFDSIDWTFVEETLKSFNFGDSVCKWFKLFCNNSKSCVINNGHMSSFFRLERGCRQGDPLAPYLFIIGVEILAIALKQNADVQGLIFDGTEYKLGQYADDAFILLDGSELSLNTTMNILQGFSLLSGLKCNITKTKAIWIGNRKFSNERICPEMGLIWSYSNFTLLGIEFSLDLQQMVEINYMNKLTKAKRTLASWSQRHMSLVGKVIVVKTLVLPIFIHLFSALPNPSAKVEAELNRTLFKFVWGGKVERIKRDIIVSPENEGGLNMIHIFSFIRYIKIRWVKRLLENENGAWQNLVNSTVFRNKNIWILGKRKLEELSKLIKNSFWRDVILALSSWKEEPQCPNEYLSMNILNFVPAKLFYQYNLWREAGFEILKDLIDDNGNLIPFEIIKQKTRSDDFLKYFSLISRIPKAWKDAIKKHLVQNNFEKQEDKIMNLQKQNSLKFVYKDLLNKTKRQHTAKHETWIQVFNKSISSEEWSQIYTRAKSCTKDTKLIAFNFKLIHRIIATNDFLKRINISEDNKCTFCKSENESIEHLFYDCNITSQFWYRFIDHFAPFYPNIAHLSKKEIFLGSEQLDCLCNFLLILAKYYIYTCRFNMKNPSMYAFKQIVAMHKNIEKYSAKINKKEDQFLQKWTSIINM